MTDETVREEEPGLTPAAPAVDLQPMAPVAESERLQSLDVLRGVAVLGILGINIHQMGLPQAALFNPTILGEFGGLQAVTWVGTIVLFLQKFMSIFGMLFGAGLIVMFSRAESSGRDFGPVHFRRMGWLLVIGAVHAYLFWWGDILFSYAICGMLVFLFRKKSPRKLLIIGLCVFLAPVPLGALASAGFGYVEREAARAELRLEAGEELTQEERTWHDLWQQLEPNFAPSEEFVADDVATHRGGYLGLFVHRAILAITYQTFILVFFVLWRVAGLMLMGMALMKWGVFSAGRSKQFYGRLALVGLGIGLPLDIFGVSNLVSAEFGAGAMILDAGVINYLASALSAMGYVGIIMLLCQSKVLGRLQERLAAVGRMALTNYLMHTVVFTTVFYGYGLGLYGGISMSGLVLLMAGMWLVQLVLSEVWLRHFRFGPVEWVWRSMTYSRRQPLRRELPKAEAA